MINFFNEYGMISTETVRTIQGPISSEMLKANKAKPECTAASTNAVLHQAMHHKRLCD